MTLDMVMSLLYYQYRTPTVVEHSTSELKLKIKIGENNEQDDQNSNHSYVFTSWMF